ncbi:MAG: hypothetical protein U0800_20350 [Isosphaeraceae bacterium]
MTLTAGQILALQNLVRRVPVAEHVFVYARDLVRATRPSQAEARVRQEMRAMGGRAPGPSQSLILGAKGEPCSKAGSATIADVRAVAPPVLRHRVLAAFHAEAEGGSTPTA